MIIDFHTHTFPVKVADRTVRALSEACGGMSYYSDGMIDGLLRNMNGAGVDVSVNLPVLTRPEQFDSVRRYALGINGDEKISGRIISFAGVHPGISDIEGAFDMLAADGFLGVKIHPDYQGRFIDDEGYVRILSEAKRYGMIVVTHAGFDCAYVGQPIRCTPDRVLRLLDRIGGYDRLVLAHLGGIKCFPEVLSQIAGRCDVYLDTAHISEFIDADMAVDIIQRHGEDRILFATDSPWDDPSEDIQFIRSLSLGQKIEDKIFFANAKKLLRIGESNG